MPEKKKTSLRETLNKRLKMTREVSGDGSAGIHAAQESGEEYPAKAHVVGDQSGAGAEMIARDKRYLDSDVESQEWDASAKGFKTVKRSGYYERYGKAHPVKGY